MKLISVSSVIAALNATRDIPWVLTGLHQTFYKVIPADGLEHRKNASLALFAPNVWLNGDLKARTISCILATVLSFVPNGRIIEPACRVLDRVNAGDYKS
jgi:hypothetical protein